MNPEKPYISIAGIIGAGKTTLAEALGKTLGESDNIGFVERM